jgi:hypothetical protein
MLPPLSTPVTNLKCKEGDRMIAKIQLIVGGDGRRHVEGG